MLRTLDARSATLWLGLTCGFLALKDVMLTPNIAGVKAVGVESLNALLVGVTKVDRCLTEERSLNRSFSYLTVIDPS